MKFFSNEAAKDNERDHENPDNRDEAAHVASDPVSVPQQRPASPWSDAPGNTDAERADREQRDREQQDREQQYRDGDGQPDGTTPEPSPGLAAHDPDGPGTGTGAATDGPATGSATNGPGTGAATYGPDGSVTRADAPGAFPTGTTGDSADPITGSADPATGSADRTAGDSAGRGDDEHEVLKDDGGFDSPKAVDPATDKPLDAGDSTDKAAEDAAVKDDGDFDSPQAVDPATDKPLDAPDEEPLAAAVPAPAAAATGTSTADRLLPDGDAFTERFRDVQLRFVDSPKEATAEAAGLVREVIDQITSNLRSQQDALASNSDDTEKLRVELRGYRDVLNRLLAL